VTASVPLGRASPAVVSPERAAEGRRWFSPRCSLFVEARRRRIRRGNFVLTDGKTPRWSPRFAGGLDGFAGWGSSSPHLASRLLGVRGALAGPPWDDRPADV